MEQEQLHSINVEVAGRQYPIFVSKEEEADVLALAEKLNAEITDTHSRYANKLSKTDILAMLLLTYAKKLQDATASEAQQHLSSKLDEIYLMLEEATT